MNFSERFDALPEYAFPRLRSLLGDIEPGAERIDMTIGEPKLPFPAWVTDVISQHAAGFNRYPPNDGLEELRVAFTDWLTRRYGVSVDPDTQVMPLNGSREGLYNISMALCPAEKNGQRAVILLPNPFYQVYYVAALSMGAEPVLVPATSQTGHLPDFSSIDPAILNRAVACYICSPANPQGAVAGAEYWASLLALAERFDFMVFADECYSEIYRDTAPIGVLEQAHLADPERIIAFHSLSKRSNLPGLRSGFVTGGPQAIGRVKQLRAYAGAPLPLPLQHAAAAVWAEEDHVTENRAFYRRAYALADEILGQMPGYTSPEAGFFLWLDVTQSGYRNGEQCAKELWQETGLRVLPGAYLAREQNGVNPGENYIRAALVAPLAEIETGLRALSNCLAAKQN